MTYPKPLYLQLHAENLKRYLQKYPNEAIEIAIDYREDFAVLDLKYRRLQQDFEAMQTELIQLQQQSSKTPKLPQLPSFLSK